MNINKRVIRARPTSLAATVRLPPGFRPKSTVIAGDSAGGGLTLARARHGAARSRNRHARGAEFDLPVDPTSRSTSTRCAEREAVLAYADAVVTHFGEVHQVYNNAGIADNGDLEKSEFKDIERVMDVDFWGVVNGTKAFLPHVIASATDTSLTSPACSG